jgi:uncharacterized protein YegL
MGNLMKKFSLLLAVVLLVSGMQVPDFVYANTNYITATKTVSPSTISRGEEATVTLEIKGSPPTNVIMPNDVILIIDRSGSMAPSYNNGDDFMASARNAAKGFIDLMDMTKHRVGVVDYSSDAKSFDLTTDKQAAKNYIDPLRASGSTATGDAIYKAIELLENKREGAQPVIVLLTDGDATVPSNDPYGYAMQAASDAKDQGIVFYTIALLQADANPDTSGPNLLMMDMATTSQHHHFVLGSMGLEAIYARIVQEIGRASAYDVVVTDLVAPEFEIVPDSYMQNIPRPTVVGNQLTWEFLELKDETLTFTYKIRHKEGERIGQLPIATTSTIVYKDYAGAQRALNINKPVITVKEPAPIITSMVEDNGHFAGGNTVTIYGENFRTGVKVAFGSKAATNVQLVNSNEITATVPAATPGSVSVKVTNSDNQFATTNYTYWTELNINSITPNTDYITGGTLAIITGEDFKNNTKVYFGDIEVPINLFLSSDRIRVRTPQVNDPGVMDVRVVNPDGKEAVLANGFTFEALPLGPEPTITKITPNSDFVTGGNHAIIEGSNIDKNAKVYFGEKEVVLNYYFNTSKIRVTTPEVTEAGVVDVKIVNPDGQEVILVDGFTFEEVPLPPGPTITKITPNSDFVTGGNHAIIEGSNIDKDAKVYFGEKEVVINYYFNTAKIRVTTPEVAEAGVVDVKIVNPDGQEVILVDGFTFEEVPLPPAPIINDISPNSDLMTGGNLVFINGANIDPKAKVYFGEIEVPINFYSSASRIRLRTPAVDAPMVVDIKVVNPDGQEAVLENGFTFEALPLPPAPIINDISPNSDLITGGTLVFINGANIDPKAKVYFGEIEVPINFYSSASRIRLRTPAVDAPMVVDIKVVNPDGQEAVLENGFTFEALPLGPPPTITHMSPDSDVITGGNLVFVNGTNFDKNARVFIGDIEVPIDFYSSASRIRLRTPAVDAPMVVDIKVVNPDGQEAILKDGFAFVEVPLGPPPTITSISPNSSFELGGGLAFIEGTNFDRNAKIYFGDVEIPINFYSSNTRIRVRVPAGEVGVVDIKVVNEDEQEAILFNGFTYEAIMPIITSTTGNSGFLEGGNLMQVYGENFDPNITATVGGVPSEVIYMSNGHIRLRIPAAQNEGVVNIVVTNPNGRTATTEYTYLTPPPAPAPIIDNITPNSDYLEGGTLVFINGANIDKNARVFFGNIEVPIDFYSSSARVRVRTPGVSAPTVVDIKVINEDGQETILQNGFTFEHKPLGPAPVITDVSPNTSPLAGGTLGFINGANFTKNTRIFFGDIEVPMNLFLSTGRIRIRIPAASAPGSVDVKVISEDGQEFIVPNGFTYY